MSAAWREGAPTGAERELQASAADEAPGVQAPVAVLRVRLNANDPSEPYRLAPFKFTGATMIIALRASLSTWIYRQAMIYGLAAGEPFSMRVLHRIVPPRFSPRWRARKVNPTELGKQALKSVRGSPSLVMRCEERGEKSCPRCD